MSTSGITILRDGPAEWSVWLKQKYGTTRRFLIGYGATRNEAVDEAVKDLEAAIDQLQQPPQEPRT